MVLGKHIQVDEDRLTPQTSRLIDLAKTAAARAAVALGSARQGSPPLGRGVILRGGELVYGRVARIS